MFDLFLGLVSKETETKLHKTHDKYEKYGAGEVTGLETHRARCLFSASCNEHVFICAPNPSQDVRDVQKRLQHLGRSRMRASEQLFSAARQRRACPRAGSPGDTSAQTATNTAPEPDPSVDQKVKNVTNWLWNSVSILL